MIPAPRKPAAMSPHAEVCLRALADAGLGQVVSIGGALGLLHYLDYRSTHDVDAWWTAAATGEARQRVLSIVTEALRPFGRVEQRQWGDVTSVELVEGGRTVFSFQVAVRSAQVGRPAPAPWVAVLVDDLDDLVASKMTALIERGAPRDFRDIRAVCAAELMAPADCWALWRRRQTMAGADSDPRRAVLAIRSHLVRIESQRPLNGIADPSQRAEAAATRRWFATEFADAA